ncbi:MAG: fumarylacetoacetate hydrolase family protein [Acidimicrobiales bacterium]
MRLGNVDGRPAIIDSVEGLAETAVPIHLPSSSTVDPFLAVIAHWDDAVDSVRSSPPLSIEGHRIGPPIPRPSKIVGIPVNYVDHQREMNAEHTVAGLGFFLKSPSSVIGPDGEVVLPFPHRRTDQEAELGVVIGRRASFVDRRDALDHVFGYTCLVDVTVRGSEERSTRKSFAGFTPIGPWITTADEIPDPTTLRIRGWVNDELRQDESTEKMVYGVAELIEFISSVVTLEVGDILATGTPAGVGPVTAGDVIRVAIDSVGTLEVPVVQSLRQPHPLWLTREVG